MRLVLRMVSLNILLCHYSVCAPSCRTLCNPMDCCPPGSSVHGIIQPRVLEWIATSSSRGFSRPRDWTGISCVSCIGMKILYHWATWKAIVSSLLYGNFTRLKNIHWVNKATYEWMLKNQNDLCCNEILKIQHSEN